MWTFTSGLRAPVASRLGTPRSLWTIARWLTSPATVTGMSAIAPAADLDTPAASAAHADRPRPAASRRPRAHAQSSGRVLWRAPRQSSSSSSASRRSSGRGYRPERRSAPLLRRRLARAGHLAGARPLDCRRTGEHARSTAGFVWPAPSALAPAPPRPPAPAWPPNSPRWPPGTAACAPTCSAARRRAGIAVHGTGRAAAHLAASSLRPGRPAARRRCRRRAAAPDGCPAASARPTRAAFRGAAAPPSSVPRPKRTPRRCRSASAPTWSSWPSTNRSTAERPRRPARARLCPPGGAARSGDHGVVGPLVIPGLTSCLRCADLHRRDRDPAWHALAVQLTVARAARAGVRRRTRHGHRAALAAAAGAGLPRRRATRPRSTAPSRCTCRTGACAGAPGRRIPTATVRC